jgi:hypothetical protein
VVERQTKRKKKKHSHKHLNRKVLSEGSKYSQGIQPNCHLLGCLGGVVVRKDFSEEVTLELRPG